MATWQTRDRLGREVILTEARLAHIRDGHPDMASRIADARATVDPPERVNRDATRPHREVSYRRTSSGRHWLRVVVHYRPVPPQGTWAGTVITAHFVKAVPTKEAPLWP